MMAASPRRFHEPQARHAGRDRDRGHASSCTP